MSALPYTCKMVLIALFLFASFVNVGSQPISPQTIAGQHAALMPRHPDTKNPSPDSQGHSLSDRAVLPMELESLRRRSNGEGMVPRTSDLQGHISSLSRYTGSGVAGPERYITTPSNPLPGISKRAALHPKAIATSGWNGGGTPQAGGSVSASDRVLQNVGSGQRYNPQHPPHRGMSVCFYDPGYDCW